MAAATSTAGKMPLTVENVQDAVVKALATQRPAAAAFAGMEDFERGNGFGLEEHTAFGGITEGKTEDEEGTARKPDNSLRRGPNLAHQFTCTPSVMTMGVGLITRVLDMLMHLGKNAGEVGSDIVTTTRAWASTTIEVLSATFVTYALLLSIIMFLQPVAAYSVEGIRHRAHAPAIYSAMHLAPRTKLDQAVWAPVESAYREEHNGSKSIKWEWGQVRGYASAVMQQIAGKLPLGTAVS